MEALSISVNLEQCTVNAHTVAGEKESFFYFESIENL